MSAVVIAETWRRNVLSIAFIAYAVLVGLIAVGSGAFSGIGIGMTGKRSRNAIGHMPILG